MYWFAVVMRNRRLVKIAVISVGAFLLLKWLAARTYNKITYSAGGLRVHKISFDGLDLRMLLTVTNQSDIPAPVTAFIGKLYYYFPGNNTPSELGTLTQVQPVQLPGFGSVDIEFKMLAPILGSALSLLNILTDGHPTDISSVSLSKVDPARFRIVGTLKIGSIPIDINTTLV